MSMDEVYLISITSALEFSLVEYILWLKDNVYKIEKSDLESKEMG